ncbi:D-alanyl-D-alanine carboxypeptidase family protein [Thermoleophilum album]|uniref:D-alanyl-D-alanine carboxypeptidase (Penicillin-binding protein 5/6) n=1 Tax=Thermoleophilum album TaxID=29539 RepID=A0A1H6FM77_THEAL|nr:serine hydrolase [Thermoleophilum album]SEH10933.1 D-alanyl-D-alanine carboxypeptidase (penicillin-binding protein 5/6) [Thermoleophilum album]
MLLVLALAALAAALQVAVVGRESANSERPGGAARAATGSSRAPTGGLGGGGVGAARDPGGLVGAAEGSVRVRLRRPPRAAVLADLAAGRELFAYRPLRRLPIASLTKIATALVVVRSAPPDAVVRIPSAALHYSGSGIGLLRRGMRVRVETLLAGLLTVSGNDAAIALAQTVAPSERVFVDRMNALARELGLACTQFVDPHGLSPRDRSCARDLVILARAAMAEPRIRRIVGRRVATYPFPIRGGKLWLASHNPLLRSGYPGTIGLKTGYTEAAGRCLVAVVRRRGRTLVAVVLGSHDPARQARALLDAGFRQLLDAPRRSPL